MPSRASATSCSNLSRSTSILHSLHPPALLQRPTSDPEAHDQGRRLSRPEPALYSLPSAWCGTGRLAEERKLDSNEELPGIRYEKDGHIATMTLDRLAKGNSLTRAMRPAVSAIWNDVREDAQVRVLVVTGSGDRHFCTGADLTSPGSEGGTSDGMASVKEEIVWSALHAEVWKPIVCAVNGLVAGGGLHFVADADIDRKSVV